MGPFAISNSVTLDYEFDVRELSTKREKRLLTRSSLRDVVILVSFISSSFHNIHTTTMAVGFSVLLAGCLLHILAKGVLIRNVVLCDRGIYSIIRHPYYLANYVIDCSFCVLSGNPYLILAYPFTFFWSYGPTLRSEEKFLASVHASSFLNHSLEVPQVFPDIFSSMGWRRMFEGFSVKRITFKECARVARFCSIGCAIAFVHAVKIQPLTLLNPLFHPTRDDYDEFLFIMLAIAFLSISIAFLVKSWEKRLAKDECRQQPAKRP